MYEEGLKGWLKHFDFVAIDLICLQIAFVLSYVLYNGGNPYVSQLYRKMAVMLMLIDFVVIFFQETYKNVLKRGYYKEFAKAIKQAVLIMLFAVLVLFASKEGADYSRVTLALMVGIYVVLRYLACIMWKKHILSNTGKEGKSSLVIVTNKDAAEKVIKNIQGSNFGRYKISGLIIIDLDMKGENILGIPVVENMDKASEYIGKEWIDEVLIIHTSEIQFPEKLAKDIIETGITLHQFLAKSVDTLGEKQFVENIGRYTVLTTTINTMSIKQAFMKRALDIVGGLVGCFLTLLITIIIAPIIYISSPGPIFFSQTRIGKNGKTFKMYKFRSMYMDAEERKAELMKKNRVKDGMMFKLDFDPRVIGNKILDDGTKKTGIGQFIRDTSLDEFPQFFNVLAGNMSLVGVRPCLLDEWDKYELHHRTRAVVKPGITGMWQVSGRSDITDFEEVVRLDREYVNNWSVGMDIKILLKTVKVVLAKDGSM